MNHPASRGKGPVADGTLVVAKRSLAPKVHGEGLCRRSGRAIAKDTERPSAWVARRGIRLHISQILEAQVSRLSS
jgi:hypothetical protein